jgi:membrane-associated phospholipid phosphatase
MGSETLLYLQSLRSPALDMVMLSISAIGTGYACMVMLALVYWGIDRQRGWLLALVFLSSMGANAIIKDFTEVLRPFQVDARVALIGPKPITYGFPSGHAQGTMMIWGSLAIMHPSTAAAILGCCIIFLVGLTRLYLGVHSPLQVGAGWVFGGLGLAATFALFRLSEMSPQAPRQWWARILWALAGCSMMILHPSGETIRAGATLIAAAMLEYWERKWIGFDDCQRVSQRIARLAAGLIPAGASLALHNYLLPEALWAEGVLFSLMGAWMLLGAPYLFKKLRI